METPYRTYILDFFLDPDDMIIEKIYGQEPIQIQIKSFGTSENIPHEIIQTNLMALGSKYDLLLKDQQPQIPDKIRSATRIRAVPIEAYSAMTSFVNGVYLETTLRNIVTDLVDQAGAKLEFDTTNENTTPYDQIIVPPSSLYKALKYLNRTFGFFNGLAGIYSSSIKIERKSNSAVLAKIQPRIHIKNLTKSKEFGKVVVTQLASDSKEEDLLDVFDGKTFYTYNPVETEFTANTAFSLYGNKMVHVVKPRNELFRAIEVNTTDFANEYGIITKKDQLFFSKQGQEKRVSYFKDHTGYDDEETFIRAIYSKYFSQMSLLKVHLEKWLILENLMNIGTGVKFNSQITDVRDLTGKYVLKFSLIHFLRASRDWECGVTMHLIRTNRVT